MITTFGAMYEAAERKTIRWTDLTRQQIDDIASAALECGTRERLLARVGADVLAEVER